jgi:hypothetical protein
MPASGIPAAPERTVTLDDLRIGELLAEGGEGRVFELPLRPHLVIKRYRRPAAREFLDDLVAWPDRLTDPALAERVRAGTSWPAATVIEPPVAGLGPPAAAGVLLPRAPRRFALRHRDGTTRLATLSYLTADPAHRAVAYGLSLPEPVSPERLGLVYALARVLEAFETANPRAGHGDLSTKNVLWSLQRGPEVFVLDCDNCEQFDPDGRPLTPTGRRRAMTPNWDDPAVVGGGNPTLASDRYSLALIFLRVVGAANFPIQARQRQGGPITVDFAVPRSHLGDALLGPGADLWDLCERGLNVSDPARRPPASAWLAPLEAVLDALGAAAMMRSVWAAQGGGAPSPPVELDSVAARRDISIRPVVALPRPAPQRMLPYGPGRTAPWRRSQPAGVPGAVGLTGGFAPAPGATGAGGFALAPGSAGGGSAPASGSAGGFSPAPGSPGAGRLVTSAAAAHPGAPGSVGRPPAATSPVTAQARAHLAEAGVWWAALHRQMMRSLWTSGHRGEGARRLAACLAVDLALALVALFVVGMIVSPVLGI